MKCRYAVLLLLMPFAAGCADVRWHKDGADSTALGRDLDDCRLHARSQAAREAPPPGSAGPRIVGVDAQGRAILSSPGPGDSNRTLAENDLTHVCMRGKGYELVPVEKR